MQRKWKVKLPCIDFNKIYTSSDQNVLFNNKDIEKQLFTCIEKGEENIAIDFSYDIREKIENVNSESEGVNVFKNLKKCIFELNPYICRLDNELLKHSKLVERNIGITELVLLKTHCFNYVVINKEVANILLYFNGENTLEQIYNFIKNQNKEIYIVNGKMAKHSWKVSVDEKHFRLANEKSILQMIGYLLDANLINIGRKEADQNDAKFLIKSDRALDIQECKEKKELIKSGKTVLLLAATPGTATIGLLYIASYLRRNGINTYCKYNNLNVNEDELKKDIEKLLYKYKPQIIGVSIKWFVHIARGIEICKIIKQFDDNIKIVIGGNTATLYAEKFIEYDFIDYVICGDGEIPMLEICKEEKNIPNCIYKLNGKVQKNSITYIQNRENSKDIFLSNLDEILISKEDLYSVPNYYIYTGKGCLMNCCYCGGCLQAQKKQFGRSTAFLRESCDVKKDLIELKKYASTFMFIDSFEVEVMNYYRELWEGIDLTNKFCHFYLYKIPEKEFIELLSRTFKYAYVNIDLCSLSERHRKYLHKMGMSKILPTDTEVLDFLEVCDKYKNVEISVSLISGLPYYTNIDMKQSEEFLQKLLYHSSFKGAEWGRLHAQPEAPIINECSKYEMRTQATTYEEFLHYSELNMKESSYPDVYSFNFPYITFDKNKFNIEIDMHYKKLYELIKKNCIRESNTILHEVITFKELYRKREEIYRKLKEKHIARNSVVYIIERPSINMIIYVLEIKKITEQYILITPNKYQEIKENIKNVPVIECE